MARSHRVSSQAKSKPGTLKISRKEVVPPEVLAGSRTTAAAAAAKQRLWRRDAGESSCPHARHDVRAGAVCASSLSRVSTATARNFRTLMISARIIFSGNAGTRAVSREETVASDRRGKEIHATRFVLVVGAVYPVCLPVRPPWDGVVGVGASWAVKKRQKRKWSEGAAGTLA
ncbi:hypothetical protein PR202_ga02556 [Eleusine coracana subsp. coracana]|uniref:Uncharacterized protein n=1 Tax=Eleusine coracana subsp. coracana TaxID=191504 RepID=A0AAV5BM15_ELECO|nr:hypothetical protein PR202_ga02556 [Eleusine coracana subsp. coracana]